MKFERRHWHPNEIATYDIILAMKPKLAWRKLKDMNSCPICGTPFDSKAWDKWLKRNAEAICKIWMGEK